MAENIVRMFMVPERCDPSAAAARKVGNLRAAAVIEPVTASLALALPDCIAAIAPGRSCSRLEVSLDVAWAPSVYPSRVLKVPRGKPARVREGDDQSGCNRRRRLGAGSEQAECHARTAHTCDAGAIETGDAIFANGFN
jgi:hypothetical protein